VLLQPSRCRLSPLGFDTIRQHPQQGSLAALHAGDSIQRTPLGKGPLGRSESPSSAPAPGTWEVCAPLSVSLGDLKPKVGFNGKYPQRVAVSDAELRPPLGSSSWAKLCPYSVEEGAEGTGEEASK